MFVATLVISGRDWLWPAAIFLALALLALGWTYRHAPAGGATPGCCGFSNAPFLLGMAAPGYEGFFRVGFCWAGVGNRFGAGDFLEALPGTAVGGRFSPDRRQCLGLSRRKN